MKYTAFPRARPGVGGPGRAGWDRGGQVAPSGLVLVGVVAVVVVGSGGGVFGVVGHARHVGLVAARRPAGALGAAATLWGWGSCGWWGTAQLAGNNLPVRDGYREAFDPFFSRWK